MHLMLPHLTRLYPLLLALALAFPATLTSASKHAHNAPYVQSMDGPSVLYAKAVPQGETGYQGTTTIYKVGKDKDEAIDTYAWYSPQGLVLGWSPIAGKVAVLAYGQSDADPAKSIGLTLHLGGKLLAVYTTTQLQALGIPVGPSRENAGHTTAQFQALGCIQIPRTNEYDFVIQAGDTRLHFDILTGKLREG